MIYLDLVGDYAHGTCFLANIFACLDCSIRVEVAESNGRNQVRVALRNLDQLNQDVEVFLLTILHIILAD